MCSNRLQAGEHTVCNQCWQSVERANPGDELHHRFLEKLSVDGFIDGLVSAFYFEKDSKLQAIIHALKYDGFHSLGVKAGRLIGERILADEVLSRSDFLIPVPLHSIKHRERGYNQSEHICKGISEITGIRACTDLLHRKKYTVSQTQLTLDERKENVGDAFRINMRKREEIEGRSFILVDDVITTGSTITACARQLKNAGAKNVHAAAIALAK